MQKIKNKIENLKHKIKNVSDEEIVAIATTVAGAIAVGVTVYVAHTMGRNSGLRAVGAAERGLLKWMVNEVPEGEVKLIKLENSRFYIESQDDPA